MRISEVATRTGVPVTALRYYETLGLIRADRSANGYRTYDESVLDRLEFIAAAKKLSLSLPEISDLIDVTAVESCTKVREVLAPLLARQLVELEAALASIIQRRDQLAAASKHVAACPDSDEFCGSECAFLAMAGGQAS